MGRISLFQKLHMNRCPSAVAIIRVTLYRLLSPHHLRGTFRLPPSFLSSRSISAIWGLSTLQISSSVMSVSFQSSGKLRLYLMNASLSSNEERSSSSGGKKVGYGGLSGGLRSASLRSTYEPFVPGICPLMKMTFLCII